jgi:GTP-binding protein
MKLKPIVVINKIDRPDARPIEVVDMVLELFIELGADDEQLDFPILYASGKDGYSVHELSEIADGADGLTCLPLLESIRDNIPCPVGDVEAPLQLLVSNIDYDNYIGRIAIGRIERGTIRQAQQVVVCGFDDQSLQNAKVVKLFKYEGLHRSEINEASVGEIACIAGIPEINIGDTVCAQGFAEPLPFVQIDEPTIAMTFSVNDSPFAGREGKFVTSRHLRDRLMREMETNVSMRLEETDTTEAFVVKGRGELHLSILIETMRREGYELQVSKPKVILKEIEGV